MEILKLRGMHFQKELTKMMCMIGLIVITVKGWHI